MKRRTSVTEFPGDEYIKTPGKRGSGQEPPKVGSLVEQHKKNNPFMCHSEALRKFTMPQWVRHVGVFSAVQRVANGRSAYAGVCLLLYQVWLLTSFFKASKAFPPR